MDLKSNRYLTLITCWYVLAFFHLVLFHYNFFPVKPKSTTFKVKPPEVVNNISLDAENNYKPEVDRIILMVIDALRNDFVTKSKMPYVYSQINKPRGCLIPAKAESPTVTMPRLKAMTTGSVPQFIDLILNFASTKITDDSLLHRAKAAGKKIIFYGDNTWLKLFPNMFFRSEGTTSFYVTDFTEVDNNVTRHLKRELRQKDWDLLFLHYLGLDHIGHVHGPFHPLISYKLQEMDEIINKIHSSIRQQDKKTVILICGDHGMSDSGGHGGSSEPETVVPLIFLGVPCNSNHKDITQTDIAPTLSALMGLELPADNIGKIIPAVMELTPEHRLYLLHYNALNLLQKDNKYMIELVEVFNRHSDYLKYRTGDPQQLIEAYETKITAISNRLIKSSIVQNVPFLYLSLTALIIILMALLTIKQQLFFIQISIATLVFTIVLFYFHDNFIISSLTTFYCFFVLLLVSTKLLNLVHLFSKFVTSPILFFLLSGTILRTISLISTSYIEEEHQIWFFFWGTVSILGAFGEIQLKQWVNVALWVLLLAGLRVVRHLNHTGMWNSVPDISDWLQKPENNIWLSIIFIIGLMGVAHCCSKIFRSDKIINILSIVTALNIFWYRTSLYYDKHTVVEARIAILLILITGIISYVRHKEIFKSLSMVWMLWISLLMRPYNIILIPVCFFASQILFKLCSSKKTLLLLHLWLAYVLFHSQGFCNFLSSIDISPGYVGLTEYSLFFTSFQVICHTYTFQILSLLLLFSKSNFNEQIKMLHLIIILRLFSVTWYCFCTLIHREHLFIWSVFSPKLLVEFCHASLLLIALLCFVSISGCTRKHRINVY